eukprot:COSAG01_NODE_35559_length_530_cov_0.932715_2_plen_39_part_01
MKKQGWAGWSAAMMAALGRRRAGAAAAAAEPRSLLARPP